MNFRLFSPDASYPHFLYLCIGGILLTSSIYYLLHYILHHRKSVFPPSTSNQAPASTPTVIAVSLSTNHTFTKTPVDHITLLPGLGIEGDCHLGKTVQHRSRLHIRPPPKNLRQVHLLPNEILREYGLKPADIGENITTEGLDVLALGRGTRLRFLPNDPGTEAGKETVLDATVSPSSSAATEGKADPKTNPCIVITGLRNPCPQIEKFRPGLQEQFIRRDAERKIIERKAGVMSTIEVGGRVAPGMRIVIEPPEKCVPLECV